MEELLTTTMPVGDPGSRSYPQASLKAEDCPTIQSLELRLWFGISTGQVRCARWSYGVKSFKVESSNTIHFLSALTRNVLCHITLGPSEWYSIWV